MKTPMRGRKPEKVATVHFTAAIVAVLNSQVTEPRRVFALDFTRLCLKPDSHPTRQTRRPPRVKRVERVGQLEDVERRRASELNAHNSC